MGIFILAIIAIIVTGIISQNRVMRILALLSSYGVTGFLIFCIVHMDKGSSEDEYVLFGLTLIALFGFISVYITRLAIKGVEKKEKENAEADLKARVEELERRLKEKENEKK